MVGENVLMVSEEIMLVVNPRWSKNAQIIDEAIVHSLASEFVAGESFETSDRDVIFTMLI